jgi:hypothetical protein
MSVSLGWSSLLFVVGVFITTMPSSEVGLHGLKAMSQSADKDSNARLGGEPSSTCCCCGACSGGGALGDPDVVWVAVWGKAGGVVVVVLVVVLGVVAVVCLPNKS